MKERSDISTQSNKNDTIPTAVLKKCLKPKSIGKLWCNEDKSVSTTMFRVKKIFQIIKKTRKN